MYKGPVRDATLHEVSKTPASQTLGYPWPTNSEGAGAKGLRPLGPSRREIAKSCNAPAFFLLTRKEKHLWTVAIQKMFFVHKDLFDMM